MPTTVKNAGSLYDVEAPRLRLGPPPEPKTFLGRAVCRECNRPMFSLTFVYPDRSLYMAYCQTCLHLELSVLAELPPRPST